jgi:hypothetical protein
MSKGHTTPLEEVLHQIETQETELTHAVLTRWVNKHPEYRDELTDYFATRAVRKWMPQMSAADEDLAGQLMASEGLNLLYKQRAARAAEQAVAKPMRLCDAVKASGITEEDFATQCRLDDLIIAKLDRRLIRVLSIPRRCLERITTALRRRREDVHAMLAGDPIPLHSYKSRKQPEVKVEDFADAVRASNLDPAEKADWIQAIEEETTNGRIE